MLSWTRQVCHFESNRLTKIYWPILKKKAKT